MFSGIVEEAATVVSLDQNGERATTLVIDSGLDHSSTELGDSIAIEGVCLTVVKREDRRLYFELAEETLRRTSLGSLVAGTQVNLERSLVIGERLHGHFVFGHVDCTATLEQITDEEGSKRFEWSIPSQYRQFIVEKGSVSLSGISLTVGEVQGDRFAVYIIPHTLEVTTLSDRKVGDSVNLEVDMLARYTQSILGKAE